LTLKEKDSNFVGNKYGIGLKTNTRIICGAKRELRVKSSPKSILVLFERRVKVSL
jgi:hypothetical protein